MLIHGNFAIANDMIVGQECWDMDGAYLGIVVEIENYKSCDCMDCSIAGENTH
jgi:hypothetical protein